MHERVRRVESGVRLRATLGQTTPIRGPDPPGGRDMLHDNTLSKPRAHCGLIHRRPLMSIRVVKGRMQHCSTFIREQCRHGEIHTAQAVLYVRIDNNHA